MRLVLLSCLLCLSFAAGAAVRGGARARALEPSQTDSHSIARMAVDDLEKQLVQRMRASDEKFGAPGVPGGAPGETEAQALLDLERESPADRDSAPWLAGAVLLARHLERVSNNAAEIAGRVRFVAEGGDPV